MLGNTPEFDYLTHIVFRCGLSLEVQEPSNYHPMPTCLSMLLLAHRPASPSPLLAPQDVREQAGPGDFPGAVPSGAQLLSGLGAQPRPGGSRSQQPRAAGCAQGGP